MSIAYDEMIKLLMIGDSGVGKSSLLLKFYDDSFSPSFITTIGVDFRGKTLEHKGKRIKLYTWDTAGQERFRAITTAYYKGAHGIIIAYDVTNEKSFLSIRNWMKAIRMHGSEGVRMVLVGNKCDLEAQREVTFEQGKSLANEYGIKFFEASAKDSTNVSEIFMELTLQCFACLPSSSSSEEESVEHIHPILHLKPTCFCN